MLTGELLRAARAMARLEQEELALESGLSLETIKRLERVRGEVNAQSRTLSALLDALARHGVTFETRTDGSVGVWLRHPQGGERRDARPPAEPSPLYRLVYYSTAETTELARDLDEILSQSLPSNAALGITGALLASDGRYLQALEGGREAVRQVYGAIAVDPRHRDLHVVESGPVEARLFAGWLMCARSAAPGEAPVPAGGFRPEALSVEGALMLLQILAELESAALAEEGGG